MDDVKGLKVIRLNIVNLVSNIDLLHAWVVLHKPNVITVSDTWLNGNMLDIEINITNYVLY